MKRIRFPSTIQLLRESVLFARKHTVLNWIAVWLIMLPIFVFLQSIRLIFGSGFVPITKDGMIHWPILFLGLLFVLLFSLIGTWALASLLVVGRRQIQSKAGRSRTSFRSVREEALPYVPTLFFTGVLRRCIVLEWSLLYFIPVMGFLFFSPLCTNNLDFWNTSACAMPLAIMTPLLLPAVLCEIRLMFWSAVVVSEDLGYRAALRRSREVSRGHLLHTGISLIGLCAVLILPAIAFDLLAETLLVQLPILADLLVAIVSGIGLTLFLLALMRLFGAVRANVILKPEWLQETPDTVTTPKKSATNEVTPPAPDSLDA